MQFEGKQHNRHDRDYTEVRSQNRLTPQLTNRIVDQEGDRFRSCAWIAWIACVVMTVRLKLDTMSKVQCYDNLVSNHPCSFLEGQRSISVVFIPRLQGIGKEGSNLTYTAVAALVAAGHLCQKKAYRCLAPYKHDKYASIVLSVNTHGAIDTAGFHNVGLQDKRAEAFNAGDEDVG